VALLTAVSGIADSRQQYPKRRRFSGAGHHSTGRIANPSHYLFGNQASTPPVKG
jgi:hypothetical protein